MIAALALVPLAAGPADAAPGGRSAIEIYSEARLLASHQEVRHDPAQGGTIRELTWSSELATLARASSDRMASLGRLEHDPGVRAALCCSSRFGDNVGTASMSGATGPAAVRSNTDRLMNAWLRSGGHRGLILDGRFTHVGIGVHVTSSGTVWATAVFQSRDGITLGSSAELTPRSLDLTCDGTDRIGFRDVSGVHAKAIECLAGRGIINGVGDGRFDPNTSVTRAQLAMLVDRTIANSGGGLPGPLRGVFSDVPSNSTAGPSIERLAAAGVVTGGADGRFRPNATATRGQFAAMLEAAAIYLDGDPVATRRGYFRDVPDTARFAHAIDASGHQGLMVGDTNRSFHPTTSLRRDHAASVIARYLDVRLAG